MDNTNIPLKILIAEDDPSISDMYCQIFKSRGHQVVITSDGKECVSRFRKETIRFDDSEFPFDVVILDHSLPLMTGVEVAKEILKLNPNQRIIFISAFPNQMLSDFKDAEKKIEFLNKPFSLLALQNIVENSHRTLKDKLGKIKKWDENSGLSESFGPSHSSQ